jgi:diguanylate cyclase (GGDEF)-like protein
MPNSNREGAAAMAERIRLKVCGQPFSFTDARFTLYASFGVAEIGNDGIEKAIKNADGALYRAKAAGRNRVAFHGEP